MKRVIGLMLFCFGCGMVMQLILPAKFGTLVFTVACLLLGYQMFCG